jgi:hypothetical protein
MKLGEYWVWIVGVILALGILLLGIDAMPFFRSRKGLRGKLVIALSFCLLWLSGILELGAQTAPTKQEPPRSGVKDKLCQRLKEILSSREFKRLKGIWKRGVERLFELSHLRSERSPAQAHHQNQKFYKIRQWVRERLEGLELVCAGSQDGGSRLSKEKAIGYLKNLIMHIVRDLQPPLQRMKCRMMKARCWGMNPFSVNLAKQVKEQRVLLDKMLAEGKISKDIYERIVRSMEFLKDARGPELDKEDAILMLRLIRELNMPLEIIKLTPELSERIEELVKELGDESWQKREEATRELILLGELAVPRLKIALKSHDPEVRWRAEYILEEIKPF